MQPTYMAGRLAKRLDITSGGFSEEVVDHGIRPSMASSGDCLHISVCLLNEYPECFASHTYMSAGTLIFLSNASSTCKDFLKKVVTQGDVSEGYGEGENDF